MLVAVRLEAEVVADNRRKRNNASWHNCGDSLSADTNRRTVPERAARTAGRKRGGRRDGRWTTHVGPCHC